MNGAGEGQASAGLPTGRKPFDLPTRPVLQTMFSRALMVVGLEG